nr:MAG TPA: major capsid protein [Caudoviricetes sp.]
MALDRNNLVALMKTVAKAKPASPVAYSWDGKNLDYDTLNETLRMEMNELAGSYSLYRENKNLIFSIIEETLDDVLPKKVEEQYN